MNDEPFEVVRGSGNVFADFGHSNAAVEQLKALLAAEIIGVLDDRALTVRKAEDLTGIAAADFSRIRKTKLDRFTIDDPDAVVPKQTIRVAYNAQVEIANNSSAKRITTQARR